MNEHSPQELTILFADICRSTTLFDQLGDETALDLVVQALQLAGEIAKQENGTVIGTIGDEVMCTFNQPEAALAAASRIHGAVQQNPSMQQHHLAMRIGINTGTVLSLSNSVYGDTVNIAARLSQQAKANQSLVSSSTAVNVGEGLRGQLRLVGQLTLQGKAGPLEVHELLGEHSEEEITEVADNRKVVTRAFLMEARYLTRQMRFDPMLVRFVFGRSMDCDQVIDHPTISREHAEFLYRNGQFVLRDFSTNGSFLVQGTKTERLHRSSAELKGKGQIYLGRTLNQVRYAIEFNCLTGR